MEESYRNIPGYKGKYQVDKEANVRRMYPSGKTRAMTPFRKKTSHRKQFVVKLTDDNGKSKEVSILQIMANTFLGPAPDGCVPHHKNGCQGDNYIQNIEYISRKELGKKTGASSKRQPVAKMDSHGEIVEVYSSAREAAKKNYMSYQTVIDRCNGKCKSAFAPDGYAYAWEDKEVSMRHAIRKIEQSKENTMPKAVVKAEDFEW